MTFHLYVVKIVLQASVRVRIAVGKVVDVALLVETERKRHDVVLAMFRTAVVVDVPVRNANPKEQIKQNANWHSAEPIPLPGPPT